MCIIIFVVAIIATTVVIIAIIVVIVLSGRCAAWGSGDVFFMRRMRLFGVTRGTSSDDSETAISPGGD